MKKEPDHFDLVPAHFTGDIDFQLMSDAERGIYCSIIFYMYQNKGYCDLNGDDIATLCNSDGDFEKAWKKIEKKFKKTSKGLTHSRVQIEYKKSKKRMQDAARAGLKGANKRWGRHSKAIATPIATERKGKGSKETPPKSPQGDEGGEDYSNFSP